jgi:hypothetical protein
MRFRGYTAKTRSVSSRSELVLDARKGRCKDLNWIDPCWKAKNLKLSPGWIQQPSPEEQSLFSFGQGCYQSAREPADCSLSCIHELSHRFLTNRLARSLKQRFRCTLLPSELIGAESSTTSLSYWWSISLHFHVRRSWRELNTFIALMTP